MVRAGAPDHHPDMTTRLQAGALAALAFALVAGCGSDGEPSPEAAAPDTAVGVTTPLEGRWRTPPITPADAAATQRRQGLQEWIEPVRGQGLIQAPSTELILDVGGDWDLSGSVDGAVADLIDYDADYAVDGDEVVVTHSVGSTTYRWAIEGDNAAPRLRLHDDPGLRRDPGRGLLGGALRDEPVHPGQLTVSAAFRRVR